MAAPEPRLADAAPGASPVVTVPPGARARPVWAGAETIHPSGLDPKGGIAHGRTVNRMGLGGHVLISDYERTREGRVLLPGHAVHANDRSEGGHLRHWPGT